MTAMPAPAQLASALYALGSVGCWGVSDFLGGHTAKRFNSFFLAALGHLGGTLSQFVSSVLNFDKPAPKLRRTVPAAD